jgi:enolase
MSRCFILVTNKKTFCDIVVEVKMIKDIFARQVLDSRGSPTVEVEVTTQYGVFSAIVPSGKSTGEHEACELRDGIKSRYFGQGVMKAVGNVNGPIKKLLVGMAEEELIEIDKAMIKLDGTNNKSKLGANAILAVSMAVCRAAAGAYKLPLYEYLNKVVATKFRKKLSMRTPVPSCNIINGGQHADNKLDFQEFMILPVDFDNFPDSIRAAAEVYHELKKVILKKYGGGSTGVGDEGGFAPNVDGAYDAMELLREAIKNTGYTGKIKIGIDAAASEFFNGKTYDLEGLKRNKKEMLDYYVKLVGKYKEIIFIEDPFEENDFKSFASLRKKIGNKVEIVGDDLTVTNVKRVKKAIKADSCNCLLLKVNQIGSISEAIEAAMMAKDAGWNVLVSHRSGETEDAFIADLACALGNGKIKTGAPCRGERTAKYNQILRISEKVKYFSGKKHNKW